MAASLRVPNRTRRAPHRGALFAVTLILTTALAGCFGEAEDEDGLAADVERGGWDVNVRRLDGTQDQYRVRSDPHVSDADGDGLDDEIEFLERTDPNKADTDGDGLLDGRDVVLDRDAKKTGRWLDAGYAYEDRDDWRVFLGERGNETFSRGGDPRFADTDEDGIADGMEAGGYEVVVNGVPRTVRTGVFAEDTDGDILWDGDERALGLDPSLADTDLDKVPDGTDLDPWRDLHARLVIEALDVETQDLLRFRWIAAGISHDSPVAQGDAAPATFSSDVLDLDDRNGNMRERQHNATMGLQAIAHRGDGTQHTLDLFSATAGTTFLAFRVHAVDGTARIGADAPGTAWPTDGRFHGPDGSVTFRVVPSGPEGASV